MKESKFIELLNLYIDRQIAPEEAAQLEEEILHNPRYRRIYREYCRMHRACTLVLENLGTQAAQGAGVEEAASRVVELTPHARRPVWGYYAAGLAAAACVTLVALQLFLRPDRNSARNSSVTVPVASLASVPTGLVKASGSVRMDAMASPVSLRIEKLNSRPMLVFSSGNLQGKSPLIVTTPAAAAVPATYASSLTRRPSIEQFVFEESPAISGTPKIYRNRQQTDGQTEMTAFQFQR